MGGLEDFFSGRGRFDRSEYYGMAASQIPSMLVGYCHELAPDERSELTRLLTTVVIGDQQHLSSHLPIAVQTLLSFCASGYLEKSSQSAALLEREFTDPANVEIWARADEMTEQQGGSDFKQTWHYAAVLSFILMLLRSDSATETRQYLIEHADSREFREVLKTQPQSILFNDSRS